MVESGQRSVNETSVEQPAVQAPDPPEDATEGVSVLQELQGEDGPPAIPPEGGTMSGPVEVIVSPEESGLTKRKSSALIPADGSSGGDGFSSGLSTSGKRVIEELPDDDPRLDPLAHCYPWVKAPRPIDVEAADRIKPDRLLNMLPFKVWVRHSMIGAELDNGPSRVWLTKNPITSNDFALDPDRVAKASICWHRFLRCTFFNTMIGSVSVIIATVAAMYVSVLSLSVNSDQEVSKVYYGTIGWIISIFVFVYPLVTSWLVLSIAFEQMMRREIYYVLLHYKIIIDLQNSSWTKGRKFANCPYTSFFVWWIIIGGAIIIAWSLSITSNVWQPIVSFVLQTVPMYLWWSTVVKQEWSLVPINKFFEMKRDAGEGMDLQTGLDFLKDCTVVPECTFKALAANLPAGRLSGLVKDICPMPFFIYKATRKNQEEPDDPTPNLLEKLREQGRIWWEKRASYVPQEYYPPDKSRARKACCPAVTGSGWAESRWASVFMSKVLPCTSELWELRRLINQYNCWTGSTWVITMWIVFGLEIIIAAYYTWGEGSEPMPAPPPPPMPL